MSMFSNSEFVKDQLFKCWKQFRRFHVLLRWSAFVWRHVYDMAYFWSDSVKSIS